MPDDNRTTTSQPTDAAALAELEAAVARYPASGEAWARLGDAYAGAAAFDLARRQLLARILGTLGNAAREAFEITLLLDPEQPDLWHPLAYCFLRLEWWRQAADTLERVVSMRPARKEEAPSC